MSHGCGFFPYRIVSPLMLTGNPPTAPVALVMKILSMPLVALVPPWRMVFAVPFPMIVAASLMSRSPAMELVSGPGMVRVRVMGKPFRTGAKLMVAGPTSALALMTAPRRVVIMYGSPAVPVPLVGVETVLSPKPVTT